MAGKKFDITKFAATLGEAVPESGTREQIEYIDEAKLSGDGENFYSMEGIEALAQNIELVGLQQPLRVRPDPDDEGGYIVVSGHRRLTAIRTICKADEPERWRTVPCIVERGELSPAMRELRLIYANSDTRRMSNADLSAQAERVEKLLYQLQEEGVEFPGRMRDHVAEVCQISKSKLARLKVIREGLSKSEQIAKAWEKGELPEATAYELAHMPTELQDEIAHVYTHRKNYYGHGLTYLGERNVTKIAEALAALDALPCKKCGGNCSDCAQGKREHIISTLIESCYSYAPCGATCCEKCSELATCKQVCPHLLSTQDQLKTDKRAAQKAERERQAEADRPVIGEITELWRRFGVARAAAGKSVAECYNAAGVYGVPDADEVTRLENGEAKYATNTKLPYGHSCYLSDIHRFTRVADLLGVSLDYLCGLTDEPLPPRCEWTVGVDLAAPEWLPLDAAHWPTEGALVVLSYETGLGGSSYLVARCAGGADDEYPFISTDAGTPVDDIVECRCDRWMPLSECSRGKEGA